MQVKRFEIFESSSSLTYKDIYAKPDFFGHGLKIWMWALILITAYIHNQATNRLKNNCIIIPIHPWVTHEHTICANYLYLAYNVHRPEKNHGILNAQECLICSWATIYASYKTPFGVKITIANHFFLPTKISPKVWYNANKIQRFILRYTDN